MKPQVLFLAPLKNVDAFPDETEIVLRIIRRDDRLLSICGEVLGRK